MGGGSNSIFVCRFCEHFAKKRGGQKCSQNFENYCYYTTFQPVQTKRGVTQVFKNIPNHSLCDLHTILNELTSIISINDKHQLGTFKAQKIIFVYFCLLLSVDFVNILPKSGGEQTLIELDPPPPQILCNNGQLLLMILSTHYLFK